MRTMIAAALLSVCFAGAAMADEASEQAERWDAVREATYSKRPVVDAGDAIQIAVPDRALDAALVPVTLHMDEAKHFVSLTLFVDNNPSPLVGVFRFGPAMSTDQIKTRVRVDNYTLIHAVGETADGTLMVASRYVKAAGGCSAPVTGQSPEIMARIGAIQLRRTRPLDGTALPSQLLISHPNYNGMQMGNNSSMIPARYLETVSVKTGGVTVFDLDSSISLSEDPAISFTYTPAGDGSVDIAARDSTGAVFRRHFDPLAN